METLPKSPQSNISNGKSNNASASQENVKSLSSQEKLSLSSWGLPDGILQHYQKKNIDRMFQWQLDCLTTGRVLEGGNLVYSAPTSAGKTLVAEILMSQTVLERRKKVIVILPFVSVVREKMFYFQSMFSKSGIRVEGYMGGHTPSFSFKQVHIAVCTIEKANSLINRMLEEKSLNNLGLVVVDELHLLGDPYRGYLLELVLTKLKYMSTNVEDINVQIVGMSATLPNLKILADWLSAELYYTDFRPVPLSEKLKCGNAIFDKKMNKLSELKIIQSEIQDDNENVGQLCLETIQNGHSVLIFCPTKVWCENLADKIAMFFWKHGCSKDASVENSFGWILRKQLNLDKINEVVEHLRMCPVGLDKDLHKTIAYGVAFHHAGLTLDERDIIEGSFRKGSIRVLCATSTLSSGVNLPARRVIIRSPMGFGGVMDVLTYKQMTGRAGRMGVDSEGESILICKPNEKMVCKQLMNSHLKPIESCLGHGRLSASLKRAILEIVASGIASTPGDVKKYADCTFLAHSAKKNIEDPIQSCIEFLEENEFIRLQENGSIYVATPLGEACLASSLPPDEGLNLFKELQRARRCFVLDSDLHIIYQVTPYSVSEQWSKLDWMNVLNLYGDLPTNLKRVGDLVGVEESFLARIVKGTANPALPENRSKLCIVRRFYTALALQDLINEIPLAEVARKFDCNKGMLQSLQQSAATYAGMVAEFAKRLGWGTVQLIVSEFQERLQFGIQRELCELMRLPLLNALRARALYSAGFTSIASLANATVSDVENALHKVTPFQSKKEILGETAFERNQRNKLETVWVTGKAGLTIRQAAEELISESRNLLQVELGLEFAKWGNDTTDETINGSQNSSVLSYPNVAKIGLNKTDSTIRTEEKQNSVEISVIDNVSVSKIVCDNQNGALSSTPKINKESSLGNAHTPVRQNSFTDYFITSFDVDQIPEDASKKDESILSGESSDSSLEVIYDSTIKSVAGKSDLSCDIFGDFATPTDNIRKNHTVKVSAEASPDIFSQSLTFDTQINRVLDFDEIKEPSSPESKPSSSFNSDDAGFVSDLSPPKRIKNGNPPTEIQKPGNATNEMITESFFLKAFESQLGGNNSKVGDSGKRKLGEESPDVIPCSDDSYVEEKHISKRARMTFLTSKSKQSFVTPCGSNAEESDDEILPTPNVDSFSMRLTRSRFNKTITQKTIEVSQKLLKGRSQRNTQKNKFNETKSTNLNASKFNRKLNRLPKISNWEKLDVVDVCENKKSFQSFSEEFKKQNIVGLALGCRRIEEEKKSIIGSKIRKQLSEKPKELKYKCKYKDLVLDGIAFYWKENEVFYFSMDDGSVDLSEKFEFLKSIDERVTIRIFDSKEQIKILKYCTGIFLNGFYEDPKIASWILSTTAKERSFDSITHEHLPEGKKLLNQIGQFSGMSGPGLCIKSLVSAKTRACVEGFLSFHLISRQFFKLKERDFDKTFKEIEMPIVACLADMELNGFRFDRRKLVEFQDGLEKLKMSLEEKAHEFAKHKFSLASNAAVSKVLYSELELGGDNIALTKRNKKPSTNKEALTELACESKHPLPDIILQWRKIRAILTKVICPLLMVPETESRIFSSSCLFTATGRISMHEPNLQNIPRDFKVVLENETLASISMREIFIASENCVLLSADYRQIELRLLAHFSQDIGLIHNITSSSDVFVSIASAIFNIPREKVNNEHRQKAKQTCYGMIYGIGAKSLSHQLRIEEKDALALVEDFKNKYPNVKLYLERTIQDCRKNGYIKSLSGRRRYLPAINDSNPSVRSEAERQAVNTTIQGSAADLAKSAMVEIRKRMKLFTEKSITVNLVLHLHDELIFEVNKDHVREVAKILKETMENVLTLTVPTPVKLHVGPSWGELEVLEI